MDFMAPCAAGANSGRYQPLLGYHSADSPGRPFNKRDACFPSDERQLEMKNVDRPVPIGGQIGIGVRMDARRDTQDCIHVHACIVAEANCRAKHECPDTYMMTRMSIYNFITYPDKSRALCRMFRIQSGSPGDCLVTAFSTNR